MKVSSTASQLQELHGNSLLGNKKQNSESFFNVLTDALNEVNEMQREADKLTQQYLTGEVTDIAQVILATEKANLALQLTVEVRNKIVEAYQEISRMQI